MSELSTAELIAIAGPPESGLSDEQLIYAAHGGPPQPAAVAPLPTPPSTGKAVDIPAVPALMGQSLKGQIQGELTAMDAEQERRMSPEGFHLGGEIGLAFAMPAAASYPAAAGMGALYGGIVTTAKLVQERGWDAVTPESLKQIGFGMAGGALTGVVTHGVVQAVFGRPAPLRRAAEETLTTPEGLPPIPVGEEAQRAYARHVDDILTDAVPKVSQQDVTAAYEGFKGTVRGMRPTDAIDVTKYNQTLQRYADKVLPDIGVNVSGTSSALEPIGSAPGPAGMTGVFPTAAKTYATVDEVIAREQGLGHLAGLRNAGGQPTVPGGVVAQLFKDTKAAIYDALTPAEQAAYTAARATAKTARQASAATDLLQRTMVAGEAGTNAAALERALRNGKARYVDELGAGLYDQVYTIAKAGQVLEKLPKGRAIMAQIVARLPGAVVGGVAGQAAGEAYGGQGRLGSLGGAMTGFAIGGGVSHLLAPEILRGLEHLARVRVGSDAFVEGLGRLGVALALEQMAPPPAPPAAGAQPFPLPTTTPRPLGQVGVAP